MTEGNGIDIPVVVHPAGDVSEVARAQGEAFRAGIAEGVSQPIELPPITGVQQQIDSIEARFREAADNIGLSIREAMTWTPPVASITDPFANQKEALAAYRTALAETENQLAALTRGNVYGREGGGLAMIAGAKGEGEAMAKAVAQYQQNIYQGKLDSPGYLSEESRRAIEAGQVRLPNREDYLASTAANVRSQVAPGDADQAIAAAKTALSKFIVDDTTYSFRNGDFFRVAGNGRATAVIDPELRAKLEQAGQSIITNTVRSQLSEVTARTPGYSQYGLDPFHEYGAGQIPGHEVLGMVNDTERSPQGLSDLMTTLQAIGVDANSAGEAFNVLRTQLEQSIAVEEAYAENAKRTALAQQDATTAAARYQARLEQLTGAFGDAERVRVQRQGAITDQMYGGSTIAEQYERQQMEQYVASLAQATRAHELEAAKVQEGLSAIYGLGGSGGGGRIPPTTMVPGAAGDDPSEWAARFAAALRDVQAAAQEATLADERLAAAYRLTAEERGSLAAGSKQLSPDVFSNAQQGIPATARTSGLARLGDSDKFISFTETGKVQGLRDAAQATDQLNAAEIQALATQARVGDQTKQTAAEMRAQTESMGPLTRAWRAFTGAGNVADSGHGGVNAFKRSAGEGAEFLGAIARYQVAYAGIFAVSRGLSALERDTTESQVAVIHLAEALGTGSDEASHFASSLTDVATTAGTSVVGALEAATRGVFAFRDQAKTLGQREALGTASAQAAAIGGVLAGAQDAGQVQNQLVSTTRDFNLSGLDQVRILDAATNAYHNYGTAIGDILQSLPIVSQQARQAGLDIEQTANFIGLIETRTGQSGSAAGTALARILESVDKPTFKTALAGVGVDTSGTEASQIQQLTAKWTELSTAQQDNFARLAVGSRGAGAFLAIMQEGTGIVDANRRSYTNLGAAQELFYKQQNTLGGLLRRVGSDLQAIGLDLARSGVLDFAGVILKALDPLLHGVDDLLKAFDLIPGSIRPIVTALGEVYLALVLIGKQQAINNAETGVGAAETGAGGLLGGLFRRGAPAAAVAGPEMGVAYGLGVPAEEEIAASSTGLLGGLRRSPAAAGEGLSRLGGALLGPLGAVAGVVALGVATSAAVDALRRQNEAQQQSAAARGQLFTASSPLELRSAASALANAAVTQQRANSGFGGSLVVTGSEQQNLTQLRAQARYAEEQAAAIEAQQQHLTRTGTQLGVFFSNTTDHAADLAAGLEAMANAGVPAVRQLMLLDQALNGLGQGKGTTGSDDLRGVFGTQTNVANLVGAVSASIATATVSSGDLSGAGRSSLAHANQPMHWWDYYDPATLLTDRGVPNGPGVEAGIAQQRIRGIDPSRVRDAINNALHQQDVGPLQVIDDKTYQLISDNVIKSLGLDKLLTGSARDFIALNVRRALDAKFALAGQGNAVDQMSQSEFNQFVSGTGGKNDTTSLSQRLSALAQTDDPRAVDPSLARLQAQTKLLRDFVNSAQARGFGGPQLAELVGLEQQSEHDAAVAEVARIERLRLALDSRLGTTAAINANDAKQKIAEVRAAVANQDPGEVVAALDNSTKATITAVKAALEHDLRIAKASLAANTAVEAAAVAAGAATDTILAQIDAGLGLGGVDSQTGVPASAGFSGLLTDPVTAGGPHDETKTKVTDKTKKAESAIKALNDTIKTINQSIAAIATQVTIGDVADPNAIEVARLQAQEIPGSAISAASVAQQVAAYDLSVAKNQEEKYAAIKAMHDADYQMLQAIEALNHQNRLNNLDTTNPVAVAREDVRTANERLAKDRARGAGADTIAADVGAARTAHQAALAAVFDQRLQDAQTAHDLGRTSDNQFLQYLEHQDHSLRRQIAGMKKGQEGYRQALDELNKIDEAIKAANTQFAGQFNLGDIKVPSPYEVRRYVAQSAGSGNNVVSSTRNVSITIHDHSSDHRAKRLLQEALGSRARSRVSTNPPKVGRG